MTKELIKQIRPSIIRLSLFKNTKQVGSGTGLLAGGFLVTCSHVLRKYPFDAIEITFGDQNLNPITPIKYTSEFILNSIANESPESEHDFAIIRFGEPELKDRRHLELRTFKAETVGEQVLFFGFPFGMQHLTTHIGYISADFWRNRTHVFQIDGSINPGNSGGPLIDIASGSVIGIVTRTETGLEKDFDQLVEAVKNNIAVIESSRQTGTRVITAGIDTVEATQVTLRILSKLSLNIKRSANVGIGFSFSSEHILETGLIKESL
jgi:hypothetical protein